MNDIPVILVCYNRPWHTGQVLKALLEHNVQNLYIFADGPRSDEDVEAVTQTRRLFGAVRWTRPKVIERSENMGLARSIVSAVDHVFGEHDRLILLEDDCVPGKYFFDFMGKCLSKYEDNEEVFGVNGYTVPIPQRLLADYPYDIYFYPRIGSWGWATWKSAWRHYDPDLERVYRRVTEAGIDITQGGPDIPENVRKLLSGQLKDVWTLNWVLSVYLRKGYYVYPTTSHIKNIGLDGTGVHCGTSRQFDNLCEDSEPRSFPDDVVLNEGLIDNYNSYFGGRPTRSSPAGRRVSEAKVTSAEGAASGGAAESPRGLSIVHINTHDYAGGAAKVAWRLAEAQRRAGHESRMLVGEKTTDSNHSFAFPIEIDALLQRRCLQAGKVYYEFQGSHRLVHNRLIRSADILHLHNLHGGYFNPYSLSALSHAKPTVWTLHDMQAITGHCAHSFDCDRWRSGCGQCPYLPVYPELLVDSSAALYEDKNQIYEHSHLHVVVPSQWLKSKVERSILRNHPVDLIYNGIDTDIFRPRNKNEAREKFGVPSNTLAIGSVAHMGTLKNFWKGGSFTESALRVLDGVLAEHVFVNIGSDGQSGDRRIINIPHIQDEDDLAEAYSMLDIFLYTPTADNCPLVVLEALSCGVPIVTFETGGIPELVRDGLDGYVTKYGDVSGVVKASTALAGDGRRQAEFGSNARVQAVSKFDHRIIAAEYERLYERCIRRRQARGVEVKYFPPAEVPQEILTQAFISAEDSKREPTADGAAAPSAADRDYDAGRDNARMTVITSIAPRNLRKQAAAIGGWIKLGLDVVSMNSAEEIEELCGSFPDVRFVRAPRDAGKTLGKPLIYIDDLLACLEEAGSEVCGIINSDIFLHDDGTAIRFIERQAKGSLVYGSRIDVESLANLSGEVYETGFDFFFFDRSLTSRFPESQYCIGAPWWDYWLPLIATAEGFDLKRLVSPFAYHIKHTFQWDRDQWGYLAERYLGYLLERVDAHLDEDPQVSPWSFLGRLLTARHNEELGQSRRAESNKVSAYVLCHSALDFLDSRSRRISCPVSVPPVAGQGRSETSGPGTVPGWDGLPADYAEELRTRYDVSIVVCTKGRARLLDAMLGSLRAAARGTTYEVIAVVGDSRDGTREVLDRHGVTNVYSESECLGPGRHSWAQLYNFGFSKATGRYAMYASDDIVFAKGSIMGAVMVLGRQVETVAGGIFFYKNIRSEPGWERYGIDFTFGGRLLMNYGLIRPDWFRKVGGFSEEYRYYCADSDLCYKLYEAGGQLVPLPESFVAHDNVFDAEKRANLAASDADIELLLRRWGHSVPRDVARPRRLIWGEDIFDALCLPDDPRAIGPGVEDFWHGLACFEQGLFGQAQEEFRRAVDRGCGHWKVHWYLAKAAMECGDESAAERAARLVLKSNQQMVEAGELLARLGRHVGRSGVSAAQPGKEDRPRAAGETDAKSGPVALVFSKDRALQLQAAIESFLLHCRDADRTQLRVLYKATSELHRRQYERLKAKFDRVLFVEQGDFKEQVLDVVGGCEHVLFLVDDNLFVGDFNLSDVVTHLRGHEDALGFSLRLGTNTNYCYAHDAPQRLPEFDEVGGCVLRYNWTEAEYDFGYPLEVSSSVYASRDILSLLERLEFDNPNLLEGRMAANAGHYAHSKPRLLCYERSVAFCDPVNKVQSVYPNRSGGDGRYSADALAEMFEAGNRIDVDEYSGFVPSSCHQEVELRFRNSNGPVSIAASGMPQHLTEPGRPISGPRFSIVMANYNNGVYVGQSIESVLDQTFEDWELIIVDDGSTDDSLAVIESYLGDRRVRLLRHERNRGYTAALKSGIAEVRSEYFGILDSDDCLAPEAVETMYDAHAADPDSGLIYSQFEYCDENMAPRKPGFCAAIPVGRTSLDASLVSHFKTFRLRSYLKTAGYDENMLYAEDIDIVYKMEEVAGLRFVDRCLYRYRELATSICHSKPKINVAIMSRVKARINALRRRCSARSAAGEGGFEELFREAVADARKTQEDVEQYFVLLTSLYEKGLLDDSDLPAEISNRAVADVVLWLAANVDVAFDELFELLEGRRSADLRPRVTVEMVTYNAVKFIGRAIGSVLAQTYGNFELLIVDDGSTDGTADVIRSFGDPRIRYIRTPHKNCASARNRVISEARGEYLLCVDSDDLIAPEYLEKMVSHARMHPEVDYFYPAGLTPVDADGSTGTCLWEYLDFSDSDALAAFLFSEGFGPIPNPGSLKRKSLFDRVGGYEDVDSVEDFVFLCTNALKIRFMRVDDHAVYFYRRLPQSSSHNFEVRDRVMAKSLADMVLAYSPEVLYPRIAGIRDGAAKEVCYYEYLMATFYKHAAGEMVANGEHFRLYGDYYKRKLEFARLSDEVGSAGRL